MDGGAAIPALEGPPNGSNGVPEVDNALGDEPALELLLEPCEDAGLGSDERERVDEGGYRETGRDWAFGGGSEGAEGWVNVKVK